MTTVSILMPMRNAAPYVKHALRSILCERSVDLEVIVVDDGSTDNSRDIAQSLGDPRVIVVDGPCEGVAASFNKALDTAAGDIIMRCDADDVYPEGRIRWQVEWLRAHPDFAAICGSFSAVDRRNWFHCELDCAGSEAKEITTDLRHGRVDTHFCAFAVRSEIARRVRARSFFRTGSDVDMQLRLSEQGRIWYEPRNAYFWRLIDNSITHSTRGSEKEFYESQARAFQAQRRRNGTDDLDLGNLPDRPAYTAAQSAASSHIQGILTAGSWAQFEKGNRRKAISYAAQALLTHPTAMAGWRNAAILLAKSAIHARSNSGTATVPPRATS